MAIPANAVLLVDLVEGEIYQDRVSYLLVYIITSDGLGAVTARYYNQATGLFETYTAYDNSLVTIESGS